MLGFSDGNELMKHPATGISSGAKLASIVKYLSRYQSNMAKLKKIVMFKFSQQLLPFIK